jgi:hypothetical protein
MRGSHETKSMSPRTPRRPFGHLLPRGEKRQQAAPASRSALPHPPARFRHGRLPFVNACPGILGHRRKRAHARRGRNRHAARCLGKKISTPSRPPRGAVFLSAAAPPRAVGFPACRRIAAIPPGRAAQPCPRATAATHCISRFYFKPCPPLLQIYHNPRLSIVKKE